MVQKQDAVWGLEESPLIKTYTLANFRSLPHLQCLSEEKLFEMGVVGKVLPFKTNNYVVENLINWNNIPDDPIFVLNFPQREMLIPEHYNKMASLLTEGAGKEEVQKTVNEIRMSLNPHPAGQLELNVPSLKDGTKLYGIQHKYRETCLFFPSQGQTCHAYCSFCFRWPQFVGMEGMKFAMNESEHLVQYLKEHPEITDVLFTGGDPMIMKASRLDIYTEALLNGEIPNLKTIRIGTKSLSYWPYKFLTDEDAEQTLEIFNKITKRGLHLAIMGHFNHPVELSTEAVKEAIKRIRSTGAQIRTQSPILRHINDDPNLWAELWRRQVQLGCIPYYMFVARDTGAQHFFGMSLVKAQEIFRDAYKQVSGLCRSVRGPSMSATPGKVQVLGVSEINNKKVVVLRFLQGRNPDWVQIPFFAEYDESAKWLNELKPVGGGKFFFEEEMESILNGRKEQDIPDS